MVSLEVVQCTASKTTCGNSDFYYSHVRDEGTEGHREKRKKFKESETSTRGSLCLRSRVKINSFLKLITPMLHISIKVMKLTLAKVHIYIYIYNLSLVRICYFWASAFKW